MPARGGEVDVIVAGAGMGCRHADQKGMSSPWPALLAEEVGVGEDVVVPGARIDVDVSREPGADVIIASAAEERVVRVILEVVVTLAAFRPFVAAPASQNVIAARAAQEVVPAVEKIAPLTAVELIVA